ncbi:MAG TPA: membrane-bound lytic murein transglycosylase MltF [Methylophaga aminisulfidivorans]|uniref:Membrane-bound lytic murein transglycosylase F n=1 Tax=Methylophaga thalassica TaxID=40223 RepID=A0ABQ5TXA6_9GAMM|nr:MULTISPECIES: membrane-bound lytic murein transglycosylase MltF [Methylophaga]WVI85076.1 membrane-bound lytic murein transglycosylase MltF [Methylophaga thalassica]GLQ00186.1 membrane-bound lytic murein transglycosylase F [Methylophaga thalassica]HIC46445.1 membrane-bound lytic murein transglycosylase MltF [Methylophaga sp.]HIM38570.1 membrane-bound lytic murein transglycosylase MltF [Methylophaga aminisulfidivorans]
MRRLIISLLAMAMLTACGEAPPQLDQIKERGELRVLSRYSLTSYYVKGNDALAGFEYELAERFADRLGVKLKVIVPENLGTMLHMIEEGRADIAAAGLTVTEQRKELLRFGPVYHEVTQQLVYKHGNIRPKDITDIVNGTLEVVADSSHVEQLQALQQEIPELSWRENKELDSRGLLELVQLELIDYTIVDSNEMSANQSLFPELRVAFDISDPQPLAWAMAPTDDESLYLEVVDFFHDIEASGELDKLIEKYYGHIRRFDYVDTRAIHRRIQTHLPQYKDLFKAAADEYGFDWHLLAAMAYQESHWNPEAVSSTGVKGLMMLTRSTAKQLGVTDREDPEQSIFAGAAYLASLYSRLPERIKDPDRTWFALAAYNTGLGHLEDARVITQSIGKNPDSWSDVRESLPLLSKKKWYSKTKHGYARGSEPVRYVQNTRRYLNIILHHEDMTTPAAPSIPDVDEKLPAAL